MHDDETVKKTVIEIWVGADTAFRSTDIEITKGFLSSLGTMVVRMKMDNNCVTTGADITLLMLERITTVGSAYTQR